MTETRVAPLKVVSFTYEIRDEKGTVLERIDLPVSYLHGGRGDIFPRVERALAGRAVGDRVEVTLNADQGFGPHRPELTFTDDIANVPPEFRFVGAEVEMQNEHGEPKTFVVSRIEDGRLTVDGNHPFAGRTITYFVKVTAIRDATGEEVARGAPADATTALH